MRWVNFKIIQNTIKYQIALSRLDSSNLSNINTGLSLLQVDTIDRNDEVEKHLQRAATHCNASGQQLFISTPKQKGGFQQVQLKVSLTHHARVKNTTIGIGCHWFGPAGCKILYIPTVGSQTFWEHKQKFRFKKTKVQVRGPMSHSLATATSRDEVLCTGTPLFDH